MTDAPRVPVERLTFAATGLPGQAVGAAPGDPLAGNRSGARDDTVAKPESGGCYGGLKQNLTIHWTVQDR